MTMRLDLAESVVGPSPRSEIRPRRDAWVSPPAEGAARRERDEFLFEAGEIIGSIQRRKLWIAASALVFLLGAGVVIRATKPIYKSSAEIMIDPRGIKITENDIVPRPLSSDVYDAIIDTQVRLALSDPVLSAVVQQLDLSADAFFNRPEAEPETGASGQDGPIVARLRRQLTVQREGKSFMVSVTAAADKADTADRIAAAVVDALMKELDTLRHDATTRAREALNASLTSQRQGLIEAENAVERYKLRYGIVDADGQALNSGRLTELNLQLLNAHNATLALAARLQQIEAPPSAASPAAKGSDALDSPVLTRLRSSYAEVERQRENLQASLGAKHPQVREIEAQAHGLQQAIAQETSRLAEAARGDYRAAASREANLRRSLNEAETRTGESNGPLVGLRELQREAVAQRGVYEATLERERQLEQQESVGAATTTLVANAKPASDIAKPRSVLLLAAALGLGLLLGCVIVVLFERLSGKIYSPGRLTAKSGIDVIDVLAVGARGTERAKASPNGSFQHGRPILPSLLPKGDSTPASRALFRVSDAVDACADRSGTMLLVVAASPAPSRRIIAANLALAEAMRGRRILLLDADEANPGIAKAWMDEPEVKSTVEHCQIDGYPSLSLAATAFDPEADLHASAAHWGKIAHRYQRVIVDVGFPHDEVNLRALADEATAVLIVVDSGVSTFKRLDDIQRMLGGPARIVGALLVTPGPSGPMMPLTAVA